MPTKPIIDLEPSPNLLHYFFNEDKDGNMQIVNGGPNGCSLHKDKEHQMIAKNCGHCQDFHCVNATEDNKDSWVVKEFADEEH